MLGRPIEQTGKLLTLRKNRCRIIVSGRNPTFVKNRLVQLSRNAEEARRSNRSFAVWRGFVVFGRFLGVIYRENLCEWARRSRVCGPNP